MNALTMAYPATGAGQHVILASELTRWMREMPDA